MTHTVMMISVEGSVGGKEYSDFDWILYMYGEIKVK